LTTVFRTRSLPTPGEKRSRATRRIAMPKLFIIATRLAPLGEPFEGLDDLHANGKHKKDAQHAYNGERVLDPQGHRNRCQRRTP
jgi:hypothetical protein